VKDSPSDDLDNQPEVLQLFASLKSLLSEMEALLAECTSHWGYEDPIYRFYHQSFEVYALQSSTLKIVKTLQAVMPDRQLNDWFMRIVRTGTDKQFTLEDNKDWLAVTQPILEAFFHARYFLEMAVKYGHELKYPPRMVPSGWAALLCLYSLR
jgi:hypothetical protein